MGDKADMIIVGAGLSGLLTAWRCLDVNPELNILLLEASDKIAGDHTWSFNLSDVDEDLRKWIKPFIAYQWPRYAVKFPKRQRTLEIPYCTGNSETLRECVAPHIKSGRLDVRLNTKVRALHSETALLESGQVLKAMCVLDARGFEPNEAVYLGYQKFIGRTIRTKRPHGLKHPIIMDATVEQLGGYRFVYCLPFTEHEILVEDTYYTDGPDLSENEVIAHLEEYIDTHGWSDHEILRQEKGVLPITLAVEQSYGEDVSEGQDRPVQLGMAGSYYHAVTGYSFPAAIRNAKLVCDMIVKNKPNFAPALIHEMIYHKADHYHEESFLRWLNRLLFRAAKPQKRYVVLERFYGLSERLIERFYRNQLTKVDKLRLLIGKPPVPVYRALYNFSENAFIKRAAKQRDSSL